MTKTILLLKMFCPLRTYWMKGIISGAFNRVCFEMHFIQWVFYSFDGNETDLLEIQ